MTNKRAAEILENLIDQFDPDNASDIDYEIYAQPEIIIALHKAIRALTRSFVQPQDDTPSKKINPIAPNAGKTWSTADDQALRIMYEDTAPLHIICERLGRTPNSILARMVHLGCINDRDDYPRASERDIIVRDIWTPLDIFELKKSYLNGMAISALAQKFDTSEKAIQARLFYMGLSDKAPDLHLKSKDKT